VIRALLADESGSFLVEYGMVFALLALGSLAVLIATAVTADTTYGSATSNMQSFQASPPP